MSKKNQNPKLNLEQKKAQAFSIIGKIDFSKAKMDNVNSEKQIAPIMLRAGLVYSEKSNLTEVMCKPKILPLKSNTLQKLEKME